MGSFGFSKDILAQMRLSQLRELARRLGILRYSAMLREQLVAAIQIQSPKEGLPADTSPTLLDQPQAVEAEAPLPLIPEPSPALAAADEVSSSSWVALMPQDHQWAIARWSIGSQDQERALAAGGLELARPATSGGVSRCGGVAFARAPGRSRLPGGIGLSDR